MIRVWSRASAGTPLEVPLDLLRRRRVARGMPADPAVGVSPRQLLQQGGVVGLGLVLLVLVGSVVAEQRRSQVETALAGLSNTPLLIRGLETQLRSEQQQLRRQSEASAALARGLVALSSGSALISQLADVTPQGVQITEASVNGATLTLKGKAADPAPLERVNALSLLLAQAPLFKPDVRVIKLWRPQPSANAKPPLPVLPVQWELRANLATLTPAQQLPLLRRLGADGMVTRLQDLERTGVLP